VKERTHGHLVERRLTVEENDVTVLQMTLNNPPVLKERIRPLVVPQVDPVSRIPHNISRSRVLVRSVPDELLQVLDVVGRDSLGVGERSRDRERNADLVEGQVRVTGDDGTSGEVDTLAHEVTAETTFFALQAGSNRLDGTTGLLQRLRLTGEVVVHVGSDVPLRKEEGQYSSN
jgi:hypothetical protein